MARPISLAWLPILLLTACKLNAGAPPGDGPRQLHATSILVHEGTNLALAVSPAQDRIVLSLQGTLFSLPIAGGRAKAITDYLYDAREPSWSPDGSRIVFQGYRNGTWDIWSIGGDGSRPLALTNDRFDDREPQFAPDGRAIVFSSDRGGSYDIWTLSLADKRLERLTQSSVDEHSPAWSPIGGGIAYAVAVDPSHEQIVVRYPAAPPRTVVRETGTINGIAWDPSGRKISYQLTTRTASGETATELKVLDLATGVATVESQAGADVFPFRASWTDAGLVYAANGQITRRTAAGHERIPFEALFRVERPSYRRKQRDFDSRAPRQALGIAAPALSPDARMVAFGALGDLWAWEPATGGLTQLTDDRYEEKTPTWSPDGERIAFVSDKGGDAVLWIYDLKTRAARRVAATLSGLAYPSWSPDGKTIAAFVRIPGNPLASQLTLIDPASGAARPLYEPLPAQPISWSRDGHGVATAALHQFARRFREGVNQLVVIDTRTGTRMATIAPTADGGFAEPALVPGTSAASFVREGLLWRQPLDARHAPTAPPTRLTDELADHPTWDRSGRTVVYLNGDRLRRLDCDTGKVTDITPPLRWSPYVPDETWVLRAGRIFDGRTGTYLEKRDIVIEGHRIRSITPWDRTTKARVVDASDKTVIPGLFEMHAHAGTTTELQGRTWLAFGVTTVRDPGSDPYLAKSRQELWDSGRGVGPRTLLAGYLLEGSRTFYSVAEGVTSDAHLGRAMTRFAKLDLDFAKTYVRLPDDRQRLAVEAAHQLGLPVTSHEIFPAAAFGVDHVEHIGGTSRRGYSPKVSALGRTYQDVVALLAGSKMGITVTVVLSGMSIVLDSDPDFERSPQFQSFYGADTDMLRKRFQHGTPDYVAANGRFVRTLVDADVLVVTGTDGPYVPSGAGLHAELRLLVRAGLTPFQALRAATLNSATAAGVDHDLGTIEAGKLADLVVVDGDPLNDIRDADNVVMTIKNGRRFVLNDLLDRAD